MKILRIILVLALGFTVGTYTYSTVFDPMDMLASANALAANAYLQGCVEALVDSNANRPADAQFSACKVKAKSLFDKLEALRKDPGHKVNVKAKE